MDFNESPLNYDIFGGLQQINSQHPGMLQSLPRQQSGIGDMQLLQQQFMLKQVHEMQRQQQLQKQQEARKQNSMSQISAFVKQTAVNHSQALINGIPIHETSNYPWQPELMASNPNWPQPGAPLIMQGSFRGHVIPSEQGRATLGLMDVAPRHADQSLYVVPISGTRVTPSQYPPVQMDEPSVQKISDISNSLPSNQSTGFPEQVSVQERTLVSRHGYHGKNMNASFDGPGVYSGYSLENLQQVNPQQNNGLVQEICARLDLASPSETSQEKTVIKVTPSENVATLDPTEAKILFGSDDNLWDAFGGGANMGSGGYNLLDGIDLFSASPSVQSGSWSALMQSAVAETSVGGTGLQEEWIGLTFRSSEPASRNQQTPMVNDNSEQHSNRANSRLQSASSLNSGFPLSHGTKTGGSYNNIAGVNASCEQSKRFQTGSRPPHIQQFLGNGAKGLDGSLIQNPAAEGSSFYGKATYSSHAESNAKNISGSWANQQIVPPDNSHDQSLSSPSGWNYMDSASSFRAALLKNQENENSFHDFQYVDKKSPMLDVKGHGASVWKTNSIDELQHAKSGSPQVIPLTPQSQQVLVPENAFPSATQVISNPGEKGNTWLAPTSSVWSLPLQETISVTSVRAGISAQGKSSTSFSPAFPYSRTHLPNQHMTHTDGQATTSESVNGSSDRFSSQQKQTDQSFERVQTNQSTHTSRHTSHNDFAFCAEMSKLNGNDQHSARDSVQHFPVVEAAPALQPYASLQDSVSSKMSPTMWTNVPTQLHPFGSRLFPAPLNIFEPNGQSHNSSGLSFSQQKLVDQNMHTGGRSQIESGACPINSHGLVGKEPPVKGDHMKQVLPETDQAQKIMSASHKKESVGTLLTETSVSNITSTQKQIEAFGRSLKPNNILHQHYTLLHQMQGIGTAEVDHGNRSVKRFRSPDGSVDAQLVAAQRGEQVYAKHDNMARDALAKHTSITSGDPQMLGFSAKKADNQDKNFSAKDMLAFGRSGSQNFTDCDNAVSVRGEHSQISPQMASSWFNQRGTLKNGHILRMHDAQQMFAIKTLELPFNVERPDRLHANSSIELGNAAVPSQFGIVQKPLPLLPIASENFSTHQSLQPDSADVSLVVMRPKKRKSVISKLIPWHNEVTQGSHRIQNTSSAEVDWAQATNRLIEKVEDEIDLLDDGLPVLRSKRRLILTTKLMQILICPPLASILSADAILHYESGVYFVARSTLGDACSILSCIGSETPVSSNSGDLLPEKIKSSEKISVQYFSKVMEDLTSRTRILENDLLRLEKRASVSDLRLECQDLERFSVINRFAMFHGCGQVDGAESSLSSDASANAQKSYLQRYVTALPIPRNLPDRLYAGPCSP